MARLTRHEILKEDKFLLAVETVRDFYLKRQKQIFLGIGVSAAAFLLIVGGIYFFALESQRAKDELSEALRIYHAPITPSGVPDTPSNSNEPTFKSAKEKQEKALAEFRKIIDRHSSAPVGKIARYYAGLCLQALNRTKEAIVMLEPLGREKSDYGALARLAMAEIYESSGELSKATELYRQLVDNNWSVTPRSFNMMHLAQLYEMQSKPGEATKLYQQLVRDFPGTQFANEADQKLKQATR